jgi:hypothetical protein
LETRGLDVNIRDNWGKSPLDLALRLSTSSPAREEILDLFREHVPELVMEKFCTQGPQI